MKKQTKTPLEEQSKEELIKRVLNQKIAYKELQDAFKKCSDKLYLYEVALSERKVSHKVQIYMQETLSLINDVEYLKKQIKEMK